MSTDIAPAWTMPQPKVGENVMYAPHGSWNGSEKPVPAVVTEVSKNSITVSSLTTFQPHPGVRHADDPRLTRSPDVGRDFGTWREADVLKRSNEILALVTDLVARVERLEQAVSPPAARPRSPIAKADMDEIEKRLTKIGGAKADG